MRKNQNLKKLIVQCFNKCSSKGSNVTRGAFLFFTILIIPQISNAFSIPDHRSIMTIAVRELNQCLPGTLSDSDLDLLVGSDLMEDENLLMKELFFSHYYSPREDFEQWFRANSRTRIIEFERMIDSEVCSPDRTALLDNLGHAVHHIQDMASPPHVMPIKHGFWDGFEKFPIENIPVSTDCSFGTPGMSVSDLHQKNAVETHRRVTQSTFVPSSGAEALSWQIFWVPGVAGNFGHYGDGIDNFGNAIVSVNGQPIMISRNVYEDFKEGQLREAIDATKNALYEVIVRRRGACGDRAPSSKKILKYKPKKSS